MTDHTQPPGLRLNPEGGWSYEPPPENFRPEDTTILPRIPAVYEPVAQAQDQRPDPEDWNTDLDELDEPVEPSPWDYQIAGATGLPVSTVMVVLDAVDDLTEPAPEPSLRSRVWNRMWQGAAVATIALWSGFLGTMTAHTVAQLMGWGS